MRISVIVPVYNAEKYLVRCIESVLAQSLPDYELILIDDGSLDNSGLLCDDFAKRDERIRVIHQKNGGAAAARNAGLDISAGEWIAFIDSDDLVHPDYLRVLYETAVMQKADVAACRYRSFHDESIIRFERTPIALSKEDAEAYWVGDRTGATVPWGKLYHNSIFSGIRFPIGRIGEDEFVTYKILFGCEKLVVIDVPLYYYFVNRGGVSRSDYFKRLPDILDCFAEHEAFFRDSPWQKAYRLEVEKYAEAYSNAIWLMKNTKTDKPIQLAEYRAWLRKYLKTNRDMIPFEKRRDIYIAAYPNHAWFIRGFGLIKQIISGQR